MTSAGSNTFDKIRWIAASAVLLSHSFPLLGLPEPMVLGDSLGKLAVAVFFAVSGYLVCQSWDRDPDGWRFTQRRALRILPGLIVAVLVTTLGVGSIATTLTLGEFLRDPGTWRYVVSSASLVAGVETVPGTFERAPQTIFNGSLWTLRYEVSMYALLALGALAFRLRTACWGLFAAGLAALAWFSWRGMASYTLPIPGIWKLGLVFDGVRLVKLGTVFFCAASLYLLRDRVPLRRRYALVALAALWACPPGPLTQLCTVVAVPYLTLVAALRAPMAWQGALKNDLSYGIYVYAYPVQQWVSAQVRAHDQGWFLAFASSLVITLALAALSWKFVEQPALRLKPRRRPVAAPPQREPATPPSTTSPSREPAP